MRLMIENLGDRVIDTTLFEANAAPSDAVRRTTCQELERSAYVSDIGGGRYRLTPKGWLIGLDVAGLSQSWPSCPRS